MNLLLQRHSAVLAQILRYAIVGMSITALGAAIYYGCAEFLGVAPLLANSIAFIVGIVIGYIVHSRVSFKGHGRRDNAARTGSRFVVVNFVGYFLNSVWVWLFVETLGGPNWWPVVPMVFVTPLATFLLHRRWTFA